MRPLHALLVIVGLAALLVAGLFLFQRDAEVAKPAPARSASSAPEAADARAGETRLHTPDAAPDSPRRETAPASAPVVAAPAAAKSAASTKPALALSGRVVDARGKAIADAKVYVARANGLEGVPIDNLDPNQMPWTKRVEGVTGADGRFQISPDFNGELRVGARKAGYAPHDFTLGALASARDLGDLVMEDSTVLEGRVVDAAHRPVEGAELLRLEPTSSGFAFFGGARGVKVATTDARGAFRVDQLASGPWKIRIAHEAHPDKVESGETDRAGAVLSGLTFVLEEGTEIQGRVVQAPKEIGDLWVRAVPKRASDKTIDATVELALGPESGAAPRRAKVASDGTFTVRGLKADQAYRVAARDSEREFFGRTRTKWVDARAGDRGVQLAYRPETALVFQAIDGKTGEPVTDLEVRAGYRFVMPLMGENGRVQHTFPDGRVRFANMPDRRDGEYAKIDVEARGYQPLHLENLDPVDGQDLDLGVLRLERAPMLVVTVLDDASGAPIENALVTLAVEETHEGHSMSFSIDEESDESPMVNRTRRARTDRDGKARLNRIPNQRSSFTVRHGSYAPFQSEATLATGTDDGEETVRLRVGGTVTVELVDSHGAPVPGMPIRHKAPTEIEERFSMGGDDESDKTDVDGRVVFEHLEQGVHRFRADADPNGPISMGENFVVRTRRTGPDAGPEPGWSEVAVTERGAHELRLVAPTSSRLTGRVTEGGKPLAGAVVRLVDENAEGGASMLPFMGGGLQGRTDVKGEYSIDKVKVGSYRLSVSHPSRAMAHELPVRVRDEKNEQDVDLAIAVIEGRTLDEEGKPVSGVRVRAERVQADGAPRREMRAIMVMDDGGDAPAVTVSNGAPTEQTYSDADGRFVLRGVASDVDLVVKATGKDYQPAQSEVVRVAPDQTKSRVEVKLAHGATLEVRVSRADGQPGRDCLVHANPDEGRSLEPKIELTGAKGVAKFDGLKPGKWRVRAEPIGMGDGSGTQAPEQLVEVKIGEPNTATIELP